MESNRRSANAAAVYRKVFDVEISHELSRLFGVTKAQEARIGKLRSATFRMEREKNELRARMIELEVAPGVRKDSTPVIYDDPLNVHVAAGEGEGLGADVSAAKKRLSSNTDMIPTCHHCIRIEQ